jgi:multiple antibiotic resistance protein
MTDVTPFALLALTSFLTLINPLGVMTIYMTLTADLTNRQRTRTATKAVLVAFLTLCLFALSGELLFTLFNISIDSLRIVGGVIFFMMGLDMLQARLTRIKVTPAEINEYVDDISITPLAIPMICGPGAITNAIILMESADRLPLKFTLFVCMFLALLLTWLVLLSANKIIDFLGETGNKVMMRLMGLIVMVIAVEFFVAGLKPIVLDIMHSAAQSSGQAGRA